MEQNVRLLHNCDIRPKVAVLERALRRDVPPALRLLERMREGEKAWALYVFSSANTLRLYSMEDLVGLGISWLWMGIEGKGSSTRSRPDRRPRSSELQANGIRVLGSTIVGLPEHTPETIDAAIEHAVAHDTEFHQPSTFYELNESAASLHDPCWRDAAPGATPLGLRGKPASPPTVRTMRMIHRVHLHDSSAGASFRLSPCGSELPGNCRRTNRTC